jgi:hypothetical protein
MKSFARQKMFGWYDPGALVRTAVDVAFSTIFGRHSDVRTVEAITPSPVEGESTADPFDYTIEYENGPDASGPVPLVDKTRDEIWLDYVADVGDGWNSTYAVAYYLSRDHLTLKAPGGQLHPTTRGAVLVMGGDQVYPAASRAEYQGQLVLPYEAALEKTPSPSPHLFVVPGNHDWYDSLASFLRLFCEQRWFAGWKTRQYRSYFALRLPAHWWLVGTDVQLASDIDDAQVKYFERIATKFMNPDDRIILCNAEPHWIYAHIYGEADSNYQDNNLAFLENKVFCDQEIAVFLAGDLHHYRRHASDDNTQKITAGGGGAFLHPTNGPEVAKITEAADTSRKAPGRTFFCKAAFPTIRESTNMCRRNFGFLFLNPKFGVLTATLYLFTAWAIMAPLHVYGWKDLGRAIEQTVINAMTNQTGALWVVTVLLGLIFFTDTHSVLYRWLGGLTHGLAHLCAIFFIGWAIDSWLAVSDLGPHRPPLPWTIQKLLLAAFIMFSAGWIVGSEIMGIYLWASLNLFQRHQNEAFSSLHIPDFKNFLRLHIDRHGKLTIFPVGIRKVPRRWREASGTDGAKFQPADQATVPELIEEPIEIQ